MPMEEQAPVLLRYLLQPNKGFDNRFAMEAFVLSAYPIGKHHVEVVHYFYKFSFTEFIVIVIPSLYLTLNFYCYVLKFPIKMLMEFPFLHLFMYLHD